MSSLHHARSVCPVCGTPNAASEVEAAHADATWFDCRHCGRFGVAAPLLATAPTLPHFLDLNPDRRLRIIMSIRNAASSHRPMVVTHDWLAEVMGLSLHA